MLPDYHIHTSLCKHAEGEPSEYRDAARERRIPAICFTDHVPNPDGFDPAHRMGLSQFPGYLEAVRGLQDGRDPSVLLGIEADYYEGCEAFLKGWLAEQPFDLVLGSVHFIRDWGFDNPGEIKRWDTADINTVWRAYFSMISKLAESGLYDMVGHLDLPKKFGHRPKDRDLREMILPVLDRIARAGMGIEINTAGLRKPVAEIYPAPMILSLSCERGIPVCFGSDAHSPSEVGADFESALALARECGYREYRTMRHRKGTLVPLPDIPSGGTLGK